MKINLWKALMVKGFQTCCRHNQRNWRIELCESHSHSKTESPVVGPEAKLLELFVLLVHQSSEKIRFVIYFSLKIQSLVAAIMCCWEKSQMKYTVGFSWVYLCSKMPMWSYSFNVCPRNSSTLFLLRLVGFYIGTHHGI